MNITECMAKQPIGVLDRLTDLCILKIIIGMVQDMDSTKARDKMVGVANEICEDLLVAEIDER